MSANARGLLVSLVVLLVLICLPLTLVLLSGWPGSVPPDPQATGLTGEGPIGGPPPPTGVAPPLIRWALWAGLLFLGFGLGAWGLVLWGQRQGRPRPWMGEKTRLGLLVVLGLASLAVYGVTFVRPFSLQRYYNLALISLGMIAERDRGVALASALGIVALFLLYGLAHRLCRGQSARRLWAIVLGGAAALALTNLFLSTITSLDLYDYIARGRITGIHMGNPYAWAPVDYPADPFMGYVSWREATSAYGPLWEVVSGLLSRFSGDSLWTNVLAYKGLALLAYAFSVALVAGTLRRVAPERALSGTLLFAWNPLILMDGVGNGHNDLLMVAWMLGALAALSRARPLGATGASSQTSSLAYGALSLLLLAAATLVKFIPVLLFPFFLLYLLAGEASWPRRIGRGLLLMLPVILLVVVSYLPFWQGADLLDTFGRRAEMFRQTVASVAKEAWQQQIPEQLAQARVVRAFLILAVLSYLLVLARAAWEIGWLSPGAAGRPVLRKRWLRFLLGPWGERGVRPWDHLVRASLNVFLLYLLLGNFWYWSWYLIWPIALLALSGDERLVAPLSLAGCASLLKHLGLNFLWFWWGVSWDTVYQVDALVVMLMVVPALVTYAVLSLRHSFPRRPQDRSTPWNELPR